MDLMFERTQLDATAETTASDHCVPPGYPSRCIPTFELMPRPVKAEKSRLQRVVKGRRAKEKALATSGSLPKRKPAIRFQTAMPATALR